MGILDVLRKITGSETRQELNPVDLSGIPARVIVASAVGSAEWQGMQFDWPPSKLDLSKVANEPKRSFQYGDNAVILLEDVPMSGVADAKAATRVLVVTSMRVVVESKDSQAPSYVPQIWVYPQQLLSNDESYLIVGAIFPGSVKAFVMSGPTNRFVNDEEYFVREAMALIFGLKKSGIAEFGEWDLKSKLKVATYTFVSREDVVVLAVTRPK